MLKHLINLFFPSVCSGCQGFLLGNESIICTQCRHEIPLTQFHNEIENAAYKIFYGRLPVEHVSALVYFHKKGIVQEMIHGLKYRGHEEVGTLFGNWYAEDLKAHPIIKKIDAIIPVPLHKKRLKERGYNQVTAFGKALSENIGLPYTDNVLVRNVYSKTQSQKSFTGRTEVETSIFDVVYNESHHNKHFLLIDDVLTTGATLENCGKALLKIPGAKLSIVTMAMSHN